MDIVHNLTCLRCSSKELQVKRKVTYIYTYKINPEDDKPLIDEKEVLPFLFDNREKSGSEEYVICDNCGAVYPINLEESHTKIDFTILRKAIRADHIENPQFLG